MTIEQMHVLSRHQKEVLDRGFECFCLLGRNGGRDDARLKYEIDSYTQEFLHAGDWILDKYVRQQTTTATTK